MRLLVLIHTNVLVPRSTCQPSTVPKAATIAGSDTNTPIQTHHGRAPPRVLFCWHEIANHGSALYGAALAVIGWMALGPLNAIRLCVAFDPMKT